MASIIYNGIQHAVSAVGACANVYNNSYVVEVLLLTGMYVIYAKLKEVEE